MPRVAASCGAPARFLVARPELEEPAEQAGPHTACTARFGPRTRNDTPRRESLQPSRDRPDRRRALECRPRGRSSVGRASASQAEGRGFEPRRPLLAPVARAPSGLGRRALSCALRGGASRRRYAARLLALRASSHGLCPAQVDAEAPHSRHELALTLDRFEARESDTSRINASIDAPAWLSRDEFVLTDSGRRTLVSDTFVGHVGRRRLAWPTPCARRPRRPPL